MPTVPEAVRPAPQRPPQADGGEWNRMRAFLAVTDRCWIYCGALADDGYGRFWAESPASETRSDVVRPSRWMWQAYHGPIADGLVVRHRCDVTICARPDCLVLGDQTDNLLDASRRDRLTNLGRIGKADHRGAAAAARAIRTAVLAALDQGETVPARLGAAVTAALAAGDPYAAHERLF